MKWGGWRTADITCSDIIQYVLIACMHMRLRSARYSVSIRNAWLLRVVFSDYIVTWHNSLTRDVIRC
jgi:hypothetical protein